MMWVYIVVVAAIAMAPLAWAVWRGGRLRSRREAALALHRAQLGELDRDLVEGRLLASEHEAARLEVQRRLLAEAEQAEATASQSSPFLLFVTAALIPAVAVVLYVADGTPDYAHLRVMAAQESQAMSRARSMAADEELIDRLRRTLKTLDPHSEATRRGYHLLANAEISLGHLPEAEAALRQALAIHFDPTLGAETAEVISEINGRVTPEAAALFKRALAEAPAGVPWRKDAEKRVAEAGGS